MKKYRILFYIVCSFISVRGQQTAMYNFPQEKMYAQVNTTLLFPGEYLYYKLYNLDKEKSKLSDLSTIAYVELISASSERVFKHRVLLENGKGFNDYFIPTTLPSGNYKLVAYTQWMQNTGVADVFIVDVKVINPYLNEKLKTTNNTLKINNFNTSLSNQISDSSTSTFSKFELQLNKKEFQKREKVRLTLFNKIAELGHGNYSLSVRKVDEISTFEKPKAQFLSNSNFRKNGLIDPNNMLPPETDGYFLTGKVQAIKSGNPAANVDVAISIPGKDFYFTVKTTTVDGSFNFTINPEFTGTDAIIQVIGKQKELYEVILNEQTSPDYSSLNFKDFEIDVSAKKAIVDRSIYNQIENGYYSVKPDTLVATIPANSFVRYEKGVSYNLDDYKRFPTMTEVFTEIMKIVYTANDENGEKVVKVVERKFAKPTDDLAMLFIDGVFIPDHSTFLAFDALQVATIKFIRNGYVFGNNDYQGVILVTTKNKDYSPAGNEPFILKSELFFPKKQKEYFKQNYTGKTDQSLDRIPDYRLQLLWEPEIILNSNKMNFELFTSDVSGTFEIVLDGFTKNGTPIYANTFFKVVD